MHFECYRFSTTTRYSAPSQTMRRLCISLSLGIEDLDIFDDAGRLIEGTVECAFGLLVHRLAASGCSSLEEFRRQSFIQNRDPERSRRHTLLIGAVSRIYTFAIL